MLAYRGVQRTSASWDLELGLRRSPLVQNPKHSGAAVGLVASTLLGRAVEAELWSGVKPYDRLTLAGTALFLLATGVSACWIPARRAARLDPMVELRYE